MYKKAGCWKELMNFRFRVNDDIVLRLYIRCDKTCSKMVFLFSRRSAEADLETEPESSKRSLLLQTTRVIKKTAIYR